MIVFVVIVFCLGMAMHLFLIAQQAVIVDEWIIAGFLSFFILELVDHVKKTRR